MHWPCRNDGPTLIIYVRKFDIRIAQCRSRAVKHRARTLGPNTFLFLRSQAKHTWRQVLLLEEPRQPKYRYLLRICFVDHRGQAVLLRVNSLSLRHGSLYVFHSYDAWPGWGRTTPINLLFAGLKCVCFGCWVFVCVFSVFSLFLVLCDLVSVKRCLIASRIVCKLLLLNEIRAQARSRKNISTKVSNLFCSKILLFMIHQLNSEVLSEDITSSDQRLLVW